MDPEHASPGLTTRLWSRVTGALHAGHGTAPAKSERIAHRAMA